ncbi:MAG: hypothetical protein A2X87_01360 [Deltaproteobacteria bacterium GWC2_42_51]|nr:MAG: hypothetical protein A2056_01795 [Deltaproteobacteria bacterium GWA2_42_85]OGP30905.1 MAG: hypothetical protein A2067_02675 [Deltaproteobacteria bacterium GWB2_42_7]OGP34714.1 MAG: hypothetical protein A2X87_01360 [Deltaproteobacteria bacterium GWC2_42_51]OGP41222.1 MAG: hypothetical protein A2090_02310 [Deltaproteobacteria bacterium GWD2_42_10]OGP48946.1 MAG: hypothetical protein A2022_01720 [Deltaproteobacteria bacterium GWF2_42_12]OGQ27875.1 MAG: hypothetical protein A3D29_01395 [De
MKVLKIVISIIFLSPVLLEASAYLPIFKADFWIGRLDNPDEVILSSEKIAELNALILGENNEMADVIKMGTSVSKEELEKWLLEDPLPVDKNMFDKKGKPVKDAFYEELLDNMNFEAINESNELTFGIVTKRTDIRSFPTDEPVFKGPSAKDFDAFQYSAIYPPQVVALLHKSRDGQWGFFQTNIVRGWIKLNIIAFVNSKDDLIIDAEKFVLITGNRVAVFADNKGAKVLESIPMGRSFALSGEDKRHWIIKFPKKMGNGQLQWADAFIKKGSDVNIGYLPYTKKNVIKQAFKILGEKYSWGGRNGLRDCSSFIKDVFATMGINLPRHSGKQSNVGTLLAGFDEMPANGDIDNAISSAIPGITLLALNGHIMLYLGNVDGNYYALHQLFGYYDKDGFRTVNKAVVTNLELGKDSKMGALKDRIKSINLIVLDRIN